jgi:hypothetical protein
MITIHVGGTTRCTEARTTDLAGTKARLGTCLLSFLDHSKFALALLGEDLYLLVYTLASTLERYLNSELLAHLEKLGGGFNGFLDFLGRLFGCATTLFAESK